MEDKEINAISFEEALQNAKNKIINNIPSFVIESVNEMIVEKLSKSIVDNTILDDICFKIGQDDLVDKILSKMVVNENDSDEYSNCRSMIFAKNWLDFELLYRKRGWQVEYEKILLSPERNSHYWIFKHKKHFNEKDNDKLRKRPTWLDSI